MFCHHNFCLLYLAPFEQLLRPSSPTLFFTPLKAMEGSMRGAHVPTSANLNMDSLAGDVPAYPAVPAGPLSPSAMSYKTLLDNLPSQFHPRSNSKSGKKKDSGSSVTGFVFLLKLTSNTFYIVLFTAKNTLRIRR